MKSKKVRIYLSIAFSIILISFVGVRYAYNYGYIRLNYPSPELYPVHGIDVSHHQHKIDWDKLDKQKVQFAFIKATEGGDFKDTRFEENWVQAKQLNIPRGAYHFFTFCKDGREQAYNFIESVPKDSTNLLPIIDLEFAGNCSPKNYRENIINEIALYIQTIEDYYEKKVLIYTTEEFYQKYLIKHFENNPIWIRDIQTTPRLDDNRKWLFWQYADKGRIDGIETLVDLNVFYGTKEEFNKLLH